MFIGSDFKNMQLIKYYRDNHSPYSLVKLKAAFGLILLLHIILLKILWISDLYEGRDRIQSHVPFSRAIFKGTRAPAFMFCLSFIHSTPSGANSIKGSSSFYLLILLLVLLLHLGLFCFLFFNLTILSRTVLL